MRQCKSCGYLISEFEWQQLKFLMPCPCCKDRCFVKAKDWPGSFVSPKLKQKTQAAKPRSKS